MIIFSSNSKEEVVKIEKMVEHRCVFKGYSSKISINFGEHLAFKSFEEAFNGLVFGNVHAGFSPEAIIYNLNRITDGELYLYELNSSECIVREISLNELILSDDNYEFAIGCLLGARKVCECLNTMLDEELKINETTIFNLDKKTLIDIILKNDTSGEASLIGDLLFGDGDDERLYENTIKLDKTGDLSYVFIQQAESEIDEVVENIMKKDKEGYLLIDLLNWINDNPINLAKKVVEIKNPFRTLCFLLRYDEYLDNVREYKSDTEFVESENEVKSFLKQSISNLDYSKIDFKELISKNNYEYTIGFSIHKIINILDEYKNYDSIKIFINAMKEFYEVENELILKKDILNVDTLDISKEEVVIIVTVEIKRNGGIDYRYLTSLKSKEEYKDLFAYLMCNKDESIPLNKLI